MGWERVLEHYSREDVGQEIAEYCAGRWVALHCEELDKKGKQIMIRYDKDRRPLRLSSKDDVRKAILDYAKHRPRAIYASAHVYRKLGSRWSVVDRENVLASSPTLDIDSKDGDWKSVVEKAMQVIRLLEKYGIVKSVFFKWSGRGAHVHVHQNAFSEEIRRRIGPMDIAYSVTRFIAGMIGPEGGAIVEAVVDAQRVFTTPLSFHRYVDRVAVCVPPESLSEFHVDWTYPESYRHFPEAWRRFSPGEGDGLAEVAFAKIGPYLAGKTRRRRHKPLDEEIIETMRRLEGLL
ncbi:MAG: hypothetical protein B9J98_07295 [Candidatus Terraquivivens tikiterensis]|uniref:Uncharacterized protein n=1 Tax=Candidatus Terraquivivens tikiterensis TaxID=1980982 RepID=A0A2R7Y0Y5_9ARCH|nr:MAG: hypothetical protein B9J98_07295 [Candidatus Terraquivivens tikiterensis]